MGSSKKNASKSKACAPPVEGVAVCDVELKVAEEQAVETPAVQTPNAEAPASETHSPEAIDKSASGPELFEKPVEPAAPSPKLSLHASAIPLSLKPEMSIEWPFTRKRQVFNVFYFGLISLQLLALAKTGAAPWVAYPCLAFVGLLTAASVFYLFNHRHHQSSADEFSPRVRRSLRAIGLLVPAFLMFALVRTEPTPQNPAFIPKTVGEELNLPLLSGSATFRGEIALGKRDYDHRRFQSALAHFQKASLIEPSSDVAYQWIGEVNDSMFNFQASLTAAQHAIDLNPNNVQAHDIASHAFNMTGRFPEGKAMAERAIQIDPGDGEAWGNLSSSEVGLHNYDAALKAASEHQRIHYYEAQSFFQRARVLDLLGRHAEANYVRQIAEQVRNSSRGQI